MTNTQIDAHTDDVYDYMKGQMEINPGRRGYGKESLVCEYIFIWGADCGYIYLYRIVFEALGLLKYQKPGLQDALEVWLWQWGYILGLHQKVSSYPSRGARAQQCTPIALRSCESLCLGAATGLAFGAFGAFGGKFVIRPPWL